MKDYKFLITIDIVLLISSMIGIFGGLERKIDSLIISGIVITIISLISLLENIFNEKYEINDMKRV